MASSDRRFTNPSGFEGGPPQNQHLQYYPQYYYPEHSNVNYNNTSGGYNSSYMQDNSHTPYHCPPNSSPVPGSYYPSSEQNHYPLPNSTYDSQRYSDDWVNYNAPHHISQLQCQSMAANREPSNKFPPSNTGNSVIAPMHCQQNVEVNTRNSQFQHSQNSYQNNDYGNFKQGKDMPHDPCMMNTNYSNQVAPLQNLVSMVEQSRNSPAGDSKMVKSPIFRCPDLSPTSQRPASYPPPISEGLEKNVFDENYSTFDNTEKLMLESAKSDYEEEGIASSTSSIVVDHEKSNASIATENAKSSSDNLALSPITCAQSDSVEKNVDVSHDESLMHQTEVTASNKPIVVGNTDKLIYTSLSDTNKTCESEDGEKGVNLIQDSVLPESVNDCTLDVDNSDHVNGELNLMDAGDKLKKDNSCKLKCSEVSENFMSNLSTNDCGGVNPIEMDTKTSSETIFPLVCGDSDPDPLCLSSSALRSVCEPSKDSGDQVDILEPHVDNSANECKIENDTRSVLRCTPGENSLNADESMDVSNSNDSLKTHEIELLLPNPPIKIELDSNDGEFTPDNKVSAIHQSSAKNVIQESILSRPSVKMENDIPELSSGSPVTPNQIDNTFSQCSSVPNCTAKNRRKSPLQPRDDSSNHITIIKSNRKRKQSSPVKFKDVIDKSAIDLVSKRIELLKVPPKKCQDGSETVLQVLSKPQVASKLTSNSSKRLSPKKPNLIKKIKTSPRATSSKSSSPRKCQGTEPIKRSPRLKEKLGKSFNAQNGLSDELEVIIKRSDDPKIRPKSRCQNSSTLNSNDGAKESKKVLNLPLGKINLLKPIMVKRKDQVVLKPLSNNSSKGQLNLYKLKSVLQRNDVTIIDLQRDTSKRQPKPVERMGSAKPHVTVSLSHEEALKNDKSPVSVCCTPDIFDCILSEKDDPKYSLPFVSLEKIKTENFASSNSSGLPPNPFSGTDLMRSPVYPCDLFNQFNRLKVNKKDTLKPNDFPLPNAQVLSNVNSEETKRGKLNKAPGRPPKQAVTFNDVFVGPHLHFNSREKRFGIVNPNCREDSVEDSILSGNMKAMGYYADSEHARKITKINYPNAMSGRYDALTIDNSWVCVFCKRRSQVNGTGDLFGPYFLNGKITFTIPFTGDKVTNKVFSGMEKRMSKRASNDLESMVCDGSSSPKKKNKKTRSSKGTENEGDKSPNIVTTDEIWFHESCVCWAPGIYLMGGKIQGLEEAIKGCLNKVCVKCSIEGASSCCVYHHCPKMYHIPCAKEQGCSVKDKELQLLCPEHKSNTPG